jgi:DNA-binding transcriptional regulator YdaS (Cro superfamily)
MESIGKQQDNLRLVFGVHSAPKDAPQKLLRQIESAAQALAVSMQAGGHKLATIAAAVGKSESYVSRMRTGERPIPARLVLSLCAATGSNLIRQYMDLQAALEQPDPRTEIARLAGMLRSA